MERTIIYSNIKQMRRNVNKGQYIEKNSTFLIKLCITVLKFCIYFEINYVIESEKFNNCFQILKFINFIYSFNEYE